MIVSAPSRHTTVRSHPLSSEGKLARPKLRASVPKPSLRTVQSAAPKRQVGRILDDDSTLVDLIDNLLSKGVMLNADLILALADVDLIYIRLSALLCAADRVLPRLRPDSAPTPPRLRRAGKATSGGQGSGGQAPPRR